MDYQGLDHKGTYQCDEQEFQNHREYRRQKRNIEKSLLANDCNKDFEETSRQTRYGLPEYYKLDAFIKGDEELVVEKKVEPVENWIKQYKIMPEKDEPFFQRPVPAAIPFIPEPTILATLTRTTDKIDNIEQQKIDIERRKAKLSMLQCKVREKNEIMQKNLETKQQIAMENLEWDIGENDFEQYFANDYEETLRFLEKLPPMYKKKKYPHTLRETNYVKRKLNQSRRQIRDEAKVKSAFLADIDKPKYIPNKHLEADNVSIDASELSEQSTDDEDALIIGQKDESKYLLRGFHYKMGNEIRGKNDKKRDRPTNYCITRKEWFNELVTTNAEHSFFKKNLSSIPSRAAPNDEDFIIFEQIVSIPKPIDISPIKDMIENEQEEPKIINAKVPKIKKPKYKKVKKFSLTGYLFGSSKREKTKKHIDTKVHEANKYGVSAEMIEKCDGLYDRKRNINKAMRHNRMRALGIPIIEMKKQTNANQEIPSACSSSDSDWIPNNEKVASGSYNSKTALARSTNNMLPRKHSYSASNMRGPCFREPTLRRHPRLKRFPSKKYLINPVLSGETIQTKYEVPNNAIDFTQTRINELFLGDTDALEQMSCSSIDSREPYNVPRLSTLARDVINLSNLQLVRTDFTDLFNARHHHDHSDCTQHKSVHVKYQPKIPKFKLPPSKKERAKKLKPFKRAFPRGGVPLNEGMALPKIEYTSICTQGM